MPETVPLQPGFADPIFDSQLVFTVSLRALSNPGSVREMPLMATGPKPLFPTTAAVLLTLLDADTPLWLDPPALNNRVADWLAFHCGCPITDQPDRAQFAVITDGRFLPHLGRFTLGGEDCPEQSTTVIIQVDRLIEGRGRRLTGPGIEDHHLLSVLGLSESFWDFAATNGQMYPQGLDFLLTAPDALCGLPRTTTAEA